jgi:Mg2+/Co2+ transporter CorC
MGGLLVNHLGVVPAQGESAVIDGLRFTATEVDERRVRELVVEVARKRRGPAAWPGSVAAANR